MFFNKKPPEEVVNNVTPGYEVHEKKTHLSGYMMLTAMAIVVLWTGEMAISDLGKLVTPPTPYSSCYYDYSSDSGSSYRSYDYNYNYNYGYPEAGQEPRCKFSDKEKQVGFAEEYARIENDLKKIDTLNKEASDAKAQISSAEYEIRTLEQRYTGALTEKIAQENQVYTVSQIQNDIQSQKSRKTEAERSLVAINSQIDAARAVIKPNEDKLRQLAAELTKQMNRSQAMYDLMLFLVRAVFILPLFLYGLRLYFRLSKKDSPYLVIVTFALIPLGIFTLQIVCVYFWGLFLADLLAFLIGLFMGFAFLRFLLPYIGMLAAIGIFGGFVYILQKKIFNPQRVLLRRLREKKCPTCQFILDLAKNFCPNCGNQIYEVCAACNGAKVKGLPHCPNCGK